MPRHTFTFDPSTTEPFDSREAIARLEELRDIDPTERTTYESEELANLETLAAGGEDSPDWEHGETVTPRAAFIDYIKGLIDDCYEVPKSDEWPYRHLIMDYEAAALEAEQDYLEVTVDGYDFLIRA